jgi:pimeloyl-ACP methyl ester carboxylesterase
LQDVAVDLVELLDALSIDTVSVIAVSGGAPHALALGAVAPNRVRSISIVGGACQISAEERAGLVGANAQLGSVLPGGWTAVHAYLEGLRARLLSEGTAGVLVDAPAEDRARMKRPEWQSSDHAYRAEALRQGAEGWTDETLALTGPWDFEASAVHVHVEWWHGAHDRTVPLSAAQRLTGQLPDCTLHVVRGAHLISHEVLDLKSTN